MSKHRTVRFGHVLCLVCGVAGAASACGSSGASTLSPSLLPTVTGVTLAVNPPGVGASNSASGAATLSNGTSAAVSTGYTSDAPLVATITSAGVITGVSIGDVTLSLDYQGFHASKKVRVLPNYNGTFIGTYVITSCADTGGFAVPAETPFCSQFPLNTALSIGFLNTQSADLTTLTGLFALGSLQGTGTGVIAAAGGLTYTGSITSTTAKITLQNFTATSPSIGHMTGQFQIVWTDTTLAGNSVWTCTMADATRTSGGVTTLGTAHAGAPATPRERAAAVLSRARR